MATSKLQKIKREIENNRNELEEKFLVKEMGIFGSYVRNEQNKNSDVDILVDFKKPVGLFHFLDLEEYLESILKMRVDLVSRRALKPKIGEYINREVQAVL